MKTIKIYLISFYTLLIITGCGKKHSKEIKPIYIPIGGDIANSSQEISGMDWYKDNLFLLPENLNGYVFCINKQLLDLKINNNDTTKIIPKKIKFNTPNYKQIIPGFDSFESIAFRGYEVYITIEIKFPDSMSCVLVRGHIDEKSLEITIPEQTLTTLDVPTYVDNLSYETLVIKDDQIYALFETYGSNLIPKPYAFSVGISGNEIKKYPISNINYRITDATKIDQYNKFWVINYFFPRDKISLNPSDNDILVKKYGQGPTHSVSDRVERIVEYKINNNNIVLTNSPHIEIELDGEKISRNWEALARYENKGFLIATDKYPKPNTILAYIPFK